MLPRFFRSLSLRPIQFREPLFCFPTPGAVLLLSRQNFLFSFTRARFGSLPPRPTGVLRSYPGFVSIHSGALD